MNVFNPNIIPENDLQRLAAVRRYDILDTPPDGAFDRITALAARRFDVPISIISMVDHDRIWFKSHHGLNVKQIGRDPGLCASAILSETPHILSDATLDPPFTGKPACSRGIRTSVLRRRSAANPRWLQLGNSMRHRQGSPPR